MKYKFQLKMPINHGYLQLRLPFINDKDKYESEQDKHVLTQLNLTSSKQKQKCKT